MTCSANDSLVSISADAFNDSTTPSATANISRICKTDGSSKHSRLNVGTGSDETTAGVNSSAGHKWEEEEEAGILGLLVIEPLRNVSHNVRHHPCQSPAIQQALATRIINAQDLDRNRNFFRDPDKVFLGLLRQRDDFEL